MPRRLTPFVLACALFGAPPLALPGHVVAQRQEAPHVLRLATLMPRSGRARRLLGSWNQRLADRTDGRLQVRMYWGGSMGDERSMVRRMRIGQLDGASLTSGGLAQIHRPVLVLQSPGLFRTYAQLDAVRDEIGPEMSEAMEREGFHLLGWGDAGRVRLFSREPVRRPTDLRRMRPWVPRSDAVFRQLLEVVGANGVPLSVGEVYGALRTRTIDVAPGTAIAAIGLQWFTSVQYVTAQSDGFLIGGMVVRSTFLEGLSSADREALFASAHENHDRLIRGVREMDERAYEAITHRGITPVDIEAHRDEWVEAGNQTRRRLAGRVYPAALLERVERLAAAAR